MTRATHIVPLLLLASLCACSRSKSPDVHQPLAAHLIDADGVPVAGAPEPEVVQLESTETVEGKLHVTVGNALGDYTLVCDLDANKDQAVQSCSAPLPGRNYLLFRGDTKWRITGAKNAMDLHFMQDWSVTYNAGENIGLLPAKKSEETFRLFWLSSWKAKTPCSLATLQL